MENNSNNTMTFDDAINILRNQMHEYAVVALAIQRVLEHLGADAPTAPNEQTEKEQRRMSRDLPTYAVNHGLGWR